MPGVLLTIVAIAATAASVGMLSSPIFTIRGMIAAGSVGAMTVTYFCAQYMNCIVWSMYGLQTWQYPVIACNVLGTVIATYCVLSFALVAQKEENACGRLLSTTYRQVYLTALGTGSLGVVVLAVLILLSAFASPGVAIRFNGVYGGVCSLALLSSPLGLARDIIRRKNAQGLQPLTLSFGTANSVLWSLYGFIAVDPFIIVPNVLCTVACAFQFVLLFRYGRRPITETVVVVEGV